MTLQARSPKRPAHPEAQEFRRQMPSITLPDGTVRTFDGPVTGIEVAAAVGPGLAKAAMAMFLNDQLVDLATPITSDVRLRFVTRRDPDALVLIRHDAAHVLAQAVQELFPGTKVAIGPVIEDGFYYDFARDQPFTPEDFPAIEARMRDLVSRDRPFQREVWPREKAIAFFEQCGEQYKVELIRDLPPDVPIGIYRQGDWLDLCLGPHARSTADVGISFKLMKVAGAYWRGDHRNPMLSRIYGTAWRDDKELAAHLHRLEEADRRDHRRIGREMDLFHLQEDAIGSIFWHPKGWRLYRTVEDYMRRRLDAAGYQEVRTPQLVDRKLWVQSGHWEKFRENMFIATVEDASETNRVLALKPMNCPCHVQIFNQGLRSYRDLPLRMAEFGSCHRYEPSGALHGIMRVRAFTQDDAHIFCTEDQIAAETARFVDLLSRVYRDLGFDDFAVKFSDRPETRAGDDDTWDRAEQALREACTIAGVDYALNPGEGAFYGPKLEFVLRDAIGRDWQCGTLQVDFVLPERLDAQYVAEDGTRRRPVMLHRAILGSFERFLGMLIEQHAGRFPTWLAPVQVVAATIVGEADDFARDAATFLKRAGVRVEMDLRNEKINRKIADHIAARVPILAVIGRREVEEKTIVLRRLPGREQKTVSLDDAAKLLSVEVSAPDLRSHFEVAAV